MSQRSMLEFNHDLAPPIRDNESLLVWARQMALYFRSGEPEVLPAGVTFFARRHHSDECPLGEPPYGWDNQKRPSSKAGETR